MRETKLNIPPPPDDSGISYSAKKESTIKEIPPPPDGSGIMNSPKDIKPEIAVSEKAIPIDKQTKELIDIQKVKPYDRDINYQLATDLLTKGNNDAAISMYNKMLSIPAASEQTPTQQQAYQQKIASSDANALYGIGLANQKKGNKKLAEDYYNQSLGADPQNNLAYRGLASIVYDKNNEEAKTKAKQYISKAVELENKQIQEQPEYIGESEAEKYKAQHAKDVLSAAEAVIYGDTKSEAKLLSPISMARNYVEQMYDGVKDGLKEAKEGHDDINKGNTALGNAKEFNGVSKVIFSAFRAVSPGVMAAFDLATEGLKEVTPDNFYKWVMQAPTAALNTAVKHGIVDESELKTKLAEGADVIWNIALMKTGEHIGEYISKGKPIPVEKAKETLEVIAKATPEEINHAIETENKLKSVKPITDELERIEKQLDYNLKTIKSTGIQDVFNKSLETRKAELTKQLDTELNKPAESIKSEVKKDQNLVPISETKVFTKPYVEEPMNTEQIKSFEKQHEDKTQEQVVPIDQISPTQELYDKNNLKIKDEGNLPVLIKDENGYSVLDGHHRIISKGLEGEKEVKAKVIDLTGENITSKTEVSAPETKVPEIQEANKKSQELGFTDATHLINSVNKYTGNKFETVQEIPDKVIDNMITERSKEKEVAIKEEKIKVARAKTSEGFEDLLKSFGGIKEIISSEQKPKVIESLKKIAQGLSEELGIHGEDLWNKVKEYIKGKIDPKHIEEFKNEILLHVVKPVVEEQKITGIKKAQVSTEREQRGVSPLEKTMKESHEDLMTKAIELNKKNPEAKNKLSEDLINNPRPLENHEAALLAIKRTDLKNKWDEAYDAKEESIKSNDPNVIEEARIKFNAINKELNDFEQAVKVSGARTAKGLKAMDILINDEYELQSQIQKYKEANQGEISAEVEAKFKAYDEELKAKNKEIRDLQKKIEEEENIQREKFIDRTIQEVIRENKKQERKSSIENIRKERESIIGDIKNKLKERRQTLSSGIPIPVEILPDVAKLTNNYIQEGIINVEQLVDNVFNDLKDHIHGIDKRDVRDAISGYGKKPKESTRSELSNKQAEIRKVGRLISKLEDLESGKTPAKSERQKIEQSQQVSELKNKIKEFNKTYVLEGKIYKSELERNAIKEKFDVEQEKIRLKNRPLSEKITDTFVDVVNIPKSLIASADMSAPLRQGLILSVRNPLTASKASIEMFKQAFSEQKASEWLHELKASKGYKVMKDSDLYLSEPTTKLTAKEEQFISNISHKIPVWGKIVKGSERAYTGYLNKLRVDVFSQFHDNLVYAGIKGDQLKKELKSFAEFVNNASGRGNLGKAEAVAPLLNAVFFSPRYVKSRFNLINPVNYVKMEPKTRIEALKSMGSFIGVGMTVLALAKAGGAKVEEDPRSSDFGKIRIGNLRFDIWAGEQQLVRLFAQLLTNKAKPIGGKVKELGKGYKADTRVDVAEKFIRGKLSPSASATVDYMSASKSGEFKNIVGEQVGIGQEALNLAIPLWTSDLDKIYKKEGLGTAVGAGAASFFGVGTQYYKPKRK